MLPKRLACTIGVFCLLLYSGCRPGSKNRLIAEWYNTTETYVPWVSSPENSIVRLYPKGVYTQFGTGGNYSLGKWRYNDKGAYLHLHQETGTVAPANRYLKIESQQSEQLTASMYFNMPFYSSRQEYRYHFRRQQNESDYDPYSPELNQWRNKPIGPETAAALKQRVVAYLHFLEAMYHHAIDNDMEQVSDYWYPSPIRMFYGNGVRMAYSNELDDWNQCFYDSAQAVEGYKLISGQVYDLHIKTGVNNFERNLDCVEQLLKGIQ